MPEKSEPTAERFHPPEQVRTVGMYAIRGAAPDELINTPVGTLPVRELSAMFYSQVAPLEYVPDVPAPEEGGEVEVAIVGRRELEVHGRRVHLGGETNVFAWNALMALRNVDGISRSDAFALGMMHHDRTSGTAQDAWALGAKAVISRLDEAAGPGLIYTSSAGNTRSTRYHVSPRLRLVDRRPATDEDPRYFELALGSRLLALEGVQEINVPYGPPRLDVVITSNRQAEREDVGAWILNEHERYLLNLIRMAGRMPLLAPEVLECGLHAHAAGPKDRTRDMRSAVDALNATVFSDESGLRTLIIDDTEPQLIRFARSVTISDGRHMRTPTSQHGDDLSLLTRFHERLHHFREVRAAESAALVYPEPKTKPRTPQPEHIELGRKHAARAFLRGQIGLRDAYMISYRLGLEFPFLHDTVLALADGRRTTYSEHAGEAANGNPMPLSKVGEALGITYSFTTRIFARTMRRLEDAAKT